MQQAQGDTRFVLKVWSTKKVTYVSIKMLTKSQISFNPNPPKLPPRLTWFSLSIPTKRRAIQTSRDFTIILGSSWTTPNRLGDSILKSNKCTRGRRGRGWGALAWRWHTQWSSHLFSRISNRIGVLERGESSSFGSQWSFSWFWVASSPRG
jgi:hypothetical protein